MIMSLFLIETYKNLISCNTTSQKEINDMIYQDGLCERFINPNRYVTVRSNIMPGKGMRDNGHVCVFPDYEAMSEVLSLLEKNIVKNSFLDANEPADLKFYRLCTAVVVSLNEYFGNPYGISAKRRDAHYSDNLVSGNSEASLSCFKGDDSAMCVERSLAAHICFQVLENNVNIQRRNFFNYSSAFHRTNVIGHMERNKEPGAGGHAVCILFPKDEKNKVILFDPSLNGVVKSRGKETTIAGIYELNESQKKSILNSKPIVPELFICRRVKDNEQVYYRGYCRNAAELNRAKRKFIDKINEGGDR